jgi:hypothetical protein
MIQKSSRAIVLAALLVGLCTCASADITWTLNNVIFTDGTTVTGTFTTSFNGSGDANAIVSNAIIVSSFPVAIIDQNNLPGEVSFASTGFADSVALAFDSLLTSAGGVIDIAQSYSYIDGTYYFTGDTAQGTISASADVNGGGTTGASTVPEPSAIVLFGTVMAILSAGAIRRRKRLQ